MPSLTAHDQGFKAVKPLARALVRLSGCLEALEHRLDARKDAWREYGELAAALAAVLAQVVPGSRGELLTTKDMAARLSVAPKTLLRWKQAGKVRPAQQLGQRGRAAIRWKGDEAR